MPSSPIATGNAGAAFESKVSAVCLTLLLTRGAPLCLGSGTLNIVHLQAGHLNVGWNTDDILLEATNTVGQSVKAALQAKRAFSLSATDKECESVFLGALADFRNVGQFNETTDAIGLITSSLSAKVARGFTTLLDCARASLSAEDMARRIALPNYLTGTARGYLSTIKKILEKAKGGAPDDAEIWRFLCHFHMVSLDLNDPDASGLTETLMRSLLAATTTDGDAAAAEATWQELTNLTASDAGRAMSYTREKLPAHILERHGKATGFSSGISSLIEHSQIVITGINTTIAGKTAIPRRELVGGLCGLVGSNPLTFVTGDAGSGKSVLVKLAFEVVTQGAIGFAFRATSLAGTHINDVLHRFGLTLAQLQQQTAAQERKILWIESLEQLMEKPAEQRAAFLDLLRVLRSDPSWHLVITCRTYSTETVRAAFFGQIGVSPAEVNVGTLAETELEEVIVDFPNLERPLSDPKLRKLLENPFFLDMAAKINWRASDPLPVTERAFRQKVWDEVVRRIDEDTELNLPKLRGDTLTAIALKRAIALEPFVEVKDFDSRAVARLVRDSLLQTPRAGSDRYAPAHDVLEDWALMRWLDAEFLKYSRKLDVLVSHVGLHPALRRAYRRWLTEWLDLAEVENDSLILDFIQDQRIDAHWREDTIVAALLSKDAEGFLERNAALILANRGHLLRQIIHILRVACRAAIPRKLFGVESDGEFFFPKGNGWIGAAELMEAAIPLLTEEDLPLVIGFLEDWILLTRYGLQYPRGARSIARIAWHWLPRIPWRSSVKDAKERLLRVLLAIPLAAEPDLTMFVEEAISDEVQTRDDEIVLKLIFSHFASDAVVRDLPNLVFRVAEHLLGLNRTLEEVVGDHSGYETEAVNYAFGLGTRFTMDDYPASAYHGPYLRMLWHHPTGGLDFLVRMINRSCDAYAHPNNRYEHIEQPGTLKLVLPNGDSREQYANGRLFGAYRGTSVTPYTFQSALMALERWLLDKAQRGDADVETVLLDLLARTNNVAITAVATSIADAYPLVAGEAAYTLLTCRPLLKADQERAVQEPFNRLRLGGLSLGAIDAEKGIYEEERDASAHLQHRGQSLEYVAVVLQMTERFQHRVWSLIDRYRAELPPESEHDHATKVWRLQLHRIDSRNFVETGRTDEGHIIIGSGEPEADLQQFVQNESPRFADLDVAMDLLTWGQSILTGSYKDSSYPTTWREKLVAAQKLWAKRNEIIDETAPAEAGPAYVAAVCIRDHWSDISSEDQEWCATIACDTVEADADVTDHFAIVARNPMEGSRPAAFAIPALFGKSLSRSTEARLLPALSKAVIHAVGETVSYAVHGIAVFLWKSDRALALTCIQALVMKAFKKEQFSQQQRSLPFGERHSDDKFDTDLRADLRAFITSRGSSNEEEIADLKLSRWPGLAVYKYFFAIVPYNPNDDLIQRLMRRCIAELPEEWEADSNRRHVGNGRRHEFRDPHYEHELVKTLCRYLLTLDKEVALETLAPVFEAAKRFPERAADVVTWLILSQGDATPATTMWALWQRFADDFVATAQPADIDDEYSETAKLLRELFLGGNWKDARDWRPLHGETHRLRNLFQRLPVTQRGFEVYAYFLAKTGTPTLPDSLLEVAQKLHFNPDPNLLTDIAVFHLEEILSRLVYGGDSKIRSEADLREATLQILDRLITAGSSRAYKLRDDFLTPIV